MVKNNVHFRVVLRYAYIHNSVHAGIGKAFMSQDAIFISLNALLLRTLKMVYKINGGQQCYYDDVAP